MLKVINLRLPLEYTDEYILTALGERLRVSPSEIKEFTLDKRELVKGEELYFKATLLCSLDEEKERRLSVVLRKKGVSLFEDAPFKIEKKTFEKRPVVVGFGPAGIFASLILAEAGAMPIVLERGPDTEQRIRLTREFAECRRLDPEGNIQFGEGGAGAFSDGKLKVGYKDAVKRKILDELVSAGADKSILYLEKPHVGSDVLHGVIVRLREKIISLGGEVRFNSRVVDIDIEGGRVKGVTFEGAGGVRSLDTDNVIFATGHSARDTYELLYNKGVKMEAKGFGIGVRIEHPQSLINKIEYRDEKLAGVLGAADYKMVTHLKNGRSLYTFCMCPGGYVVPAASEEGGICTNGMSEFARDGENANTALLVSVTPEDFPSSHPLSGIELQRSIERRAFDAAGGDYSAPVVKLGDFLNKKESESMGSVKPSYRPSVTFASPDRYMPSYVCETLRAGIADMCEYKEGYYLEDAVITGPETRSTSPVRICREEGFEAVGLCGLYPVGEGAGYGGGIVSSAVDGILAAQEILKKGN